jgi:DNA-directed RNA polymerase subunit beta
MNQNVHMTNLPDLLEIQRSSFCWFLSEGLAHELAKFSSIFDLTGNLELRVYGHEYRLKKPKFTTSKAKERNITYSVKLYVSIEIIAKNITSTNNLVGKQKVLIGEIPLMTNKGTFIINGCERIIVNQLIRSPGVYFKKEKKKNQLYNIYSGTVITRRGSWLTFELDSDSDLIWVRIDKKYKIPINLFLAALDLTNEEIYQTVKNSEFLIRSIINIKIELIELEKKYYDRRKKTEKLKEVKNKTAEFLAISKVRELICSRILNPKYYDLGEVGRVKINKKLDLNLALSIRTLTAQDILKIIDYLIDIRFYNGEVDDIDSLINRRVRCVGELLQLQVRVGLNRLERNISEKLTTCNISLLRPNTLVNPKPLIAAMKEFFGSSQLSQFMDETNPLSELTHKRRISALGPGGLSTDHVTFAARDIHPTQYGRLCPIETPEGQNAGLIASLASHAKLNKYGFIETPFFRVFQAKVLRETAPIYLSAEKERFYKIAPADIKLTSTNYIEKDLIPVRYNQEFTLADPHEVNLVAISPIQIISAAAALIPFLEHDDANRALMGSNMQRQAVPLLYPQKPIVGTGLEAQIATDSSTGLVNYRDGIINFVSADQIVVESKNENFSNYKRYKLEKYRRSNQDTCVNQKPIVWPGQFVKSGQIIADGPGTDGGELSLGQNLTVAYMPWEGYNYEDAILVSERLVYLDLFTSIHIEKYEMEVRQTKSGVEEMTSNIPNASEYSLRNLNSNGLIYKGALVEPGDVLVGKVTPKGESDQLPEGKLLKAIFGEKTADVRDTSLRVPKGMCGRVIDVLVFSKENGDDVPLGAINLVRVFVAEVRKIKIGDKIAGRHGNKGIISRIMPIQDMPYLPDGTLVDIIFNPLGVPSRMNVGQIFECLLGFAGDQLNERFKILPFDEMYSLEASRILINSKLKEAALETNKPWLFNPYCPGKVILTDGRTGESFDNPVLVGKSYILKLIHLVDDKIHARATGPYSLVTQQPVGGKSQQGGQRFGEMEVWALEAFGSAYTLQELLTVKSDDMEGRNEVLNAIVKGQPIPKPGIPESFKVLLRELQALGLDITTYKVKKLKKGQTQAVEVNLITSNLINS